MNHQTPTLMPQSATRDLLVAPPPDARHSGRFLEFQKWVLSEAPATLPIPTLFVACLVAFDGSWTREELHKVLSLSHAWLDMDDHVAASWMQAGRMHRRLLSHFTTLCWRSLPHTSFDWDKELSNVERAYQHDARQPDSIDCLERLLHLGRHWASLVLPPLLSSQLEGAIMIAAVPDAVWVRRHAGGAAMAGPPSDSPPFDENDELLFQSAADGKSQTATWFLDKLTAAFADCVGPGVNLSNDRARRRLTENLAQLKPELVHAGVPGLLLFGWVQDLLAHGSARVSVPAIQTLRNYIQVAGPTLLRGMNAVGDVMALEVDDWKAIYEATQILCSEGQIRILNPALASFHRFLVRALDIDPIYGGMFPGEDAIPVALVLWPHELEAARRSLLRAPVEERLQAQAVVIITLLMNTSLRRSEIFTLRLSSLWFFEGGVVVEVSPKRSHKSSKSKSARRRMVIRDTQAYAVLREWAMRRRSEAAVTDDLLFADPHRPELLYGMGQTYALLMKSLKDASGDPGVGWHTCRHTFASTRLSTALMDGKAQSISPLHRLQRNMGHASLLTTLQTYCHIYEVPLRSHLDVAIAPVVTSRHLSVWTGEAANTIRQWKRRAGTEGVAHMEMVFKRAGRAPSTTLSGGPALFAEVPCAGIQDRLTPQRMVHILSDIQKGVTIAGIASASSVSKQLLGRACRLIANRPTAGVEDLESLAASASAQLSRLDFSRLDQPRWQKVAAILQSQSIEHGRNVTTAWMKHGGPNGLSMVACDEVGPVLRLLSRSGFLASQMRLRVARPEHIVAPAKSVIEREHFISLAVADAFGDEVILEHVKPRRGRPAAYLVPLNSATSCSPAPPATIDAKSLHAVMCAYQVYVALEVPLE